MREWEATFLCVITDKKSLIYRYNMYTNQIINTNIYIKSNETFHY